jgi:HD-GYP domain-containing protein (c-di-GMP phosphodiesterase class II)
VSKLRSIIQEQKKGKIFNLLLVFMLIVGTIPLVISGYNLISYNKNILARDQQVLHQQICKAVASEIRLFLQSCFNLIITLQKSLELNFEQGASEEVFTSIKTKNFLDSLFEAHDRIITINAIYRNGKGVQSGILMDETELEGDIQQAFHHCLEVGDTFVSRPRFSAKSNQVYITIGTRVTSRDSAVGVLIFVFNMTDVYVNLRRIDSGNTVFVLDGGGDLILHPNILRFSQEVNMANHPIFLEMKKLSTHAISTFPFEEKTDDASVGMVGSVYMIPENHVDWGVAVQTPQDVANLDIVKMQLQTITWIVLSIILALIMSFIFSQRLSIPIQKLTTKTLSITEGNFSERVDIKSRNEIGILADNFNLMSEKIENYIERLKKAAEQNRQLFIGAVRTLTAAIDAKDPYTRGHSERVTQYSLLIAREMGLPAKDIERIYLAGLLHDVGKIGITDSILQKPGLLTEEEYALMKQHPQLGADIMNQIPQLKEVLPGIRHHHEWLDGSGYPDGLCGDDIPQDALIIGVADCFDAMTTERPYQKPFTVEAALSRIKSFIGKRFSSGPVEALWRAYEKGKILQPDQSEIKKYRYITSN